MVIIDDNGLTNESGKKTICCQIIATNLSTNMCDSLINNLQVIWQTEGARAGLRLHEAPGWNLQMTPF